MNEAVRQQLLNLNLAFYRDMAAPFARSRVRPQPGFHLLLAELGPFRDHLLDVGCGDGRLGRFLLARQAIKGYTGLDFSPELLAAAQATTAGTFFHRQLGQPGALQSLGYFDAMTCLATLQHLPGRANRLELLQEMEDHLHPGGRLFISNWQFLESPRQRRKLVAWSQAGLTSKQVEPMDYLLAWRRNKFALRYVTLIDETEMVALAAEAGLVTRRSFRSDGKEGDLNLYTVLAKDESA